MLSEALYTIVPRIHYLLLLATRPPHAACPLCSPFPRGPSVRAHQLRLRLTRLHCLIVCDLHQLGGGGGEGKKKKSRLGHAIFGL